MKNQRFKDFYFTATRPVTKLNYYFHYFLSSFFYRKYKDKPIWLNLGSGANYLQGFINIEGNIMRKKDMWLDLRNPLPFRNNSIDAIYSCHVFEHFYIKELEKILSEAHRILKFGGGVRILVPSLEKAIAAYVNKKPDWFSNFPLSYKSLGGKFQNFIFCDGQHKLAFDFSFLKEILWKSQFTKVIKCNSGESRLFPTTVIDRIENRDYHNHISLIVEAIKE